jgi:hypothetical protein
VRAVLGEAASSRLDETPLAPFVVAAHGAETVVPIVVGPRGVSTVLVR